MIQPVQNLSKPRKFLIGGLLVSLALVLVFTIAFFTDKTSSETYLTTASFEKDGFMLTTTMPPTPYVAGEDVTAILSDGYSKNEDISCSVKMTAK